MEDVNMLKPKEIDIKKICQDNGIRIYAYQDVPAILEAIGLDPQGGTPGLSLKQPDGPAVILYDRERPAMERRFSIAHELGHILLGHLDYRQKGTGQYPEFAESEANYFAVALMTHEIIREYGQGVGA